MKKCHILVFLLSCLFSISIFGEDLDLSNTTPLIKIRENISIGIYEETDYRRDSLWGNTGTVAFTPGLEILANIEKAEIYLYDEYYGNTSYEINTLASGQYRLKIVKTGYRSEEFSFFLDMSKRTVIKIELLPDVGELILTGITTDTTIIANNVEVNNSRIKKTISDDVVIELPIGTNKIRLKRFGFSAEDFSVDISSEKSSQYNVNWRESDPEILDFDILPRFGSFFTTNPQKITFIAELNRSGTLTVTLLNKTGELLGSTSLISKLPLVNGLIETKTNLPKGEYTIRAQFSSLGKIVTVEKPFYVSSKNLNRYQTTSSGISGLLFAPSAKTLYPYSYAFAVEGKGYYDFSKSEAAIPLFISGRFSPYFNLEASLNVLFSFEPNTGDSLLNLSTGCKYNLPLNSDLFSLGFGLRFTYCGILPEFTGASTQDIYSNTTGTAVLIPLEFQFSFFRIMLTPELNITPFELSNLNVAGEYFEPFSGVDIYSTIRLGGEFHWNGLVVGLSGAFKTPGFVTGNTDWISGYIGCEVGFTIPDTILQINGLYFMELKQNGLETMGGGLSLGLLL